MPALRLLLLSVFVPLLVGCAGRGVPLPSATGESPAARAILEASAHAHGGDAWLTFKDLSVSYAGEWYGLVSRLQPTLVDEGFRRSSEERLLLGDDVLIGQSHSGPSGHKQVRRSRDQLMVTRNGVTDTNAESLAAAALVADAYRFFLTGPFYFLSGNAHLETRGVATVDGHECDVLLAVRRPGHGLSAEDRYLLYIDRIDHLLRRVRFTMDGLESTRGAVVEVDLLDHVEIAGVLWPTRFFERLKKPIPNLPVHDWRLTGLDVNRGLSSGDLGPSGFGGRAAEPASVLLRRE